MQPKKRLWTAAWLETVFLRRCLASMALRYRTTVQLPDSAAQSADRFPIFARRAVCFPGEQLGEKCRVLVSYRFRHDGDRLVRIGQQPFRMLRPNPVQIMDDARPDIFVELPVQLPLPDMEQVGQQSKRNFLIVMPFHIAAYAAYQQLAWRTEPGLFIAHVIVPGKQDEQFRHLQLNERLESAMTPLHFPLDLLQQLHRLLGRFPLHVQLMVKTGFPVQKRLDIKKIERFRQLHLAEQRARDEIGLKQAVYDLDTLIVIQHVFVHLAGIDHKYVTRSQVKRSVLNEMRRLPFHDKNQLHKFVHVLDRLIDAIVIVALNPKRKIARMRIVIHQLRFQQRHLAFEIALSYHISAYLLAADLRLLRLLGRERTRLPFFLPDALFFRSLFWLLALRLLDLSGSIIVGSDGSNRACIDAFS